MKFVVNKDRAGEYRWVLKAGNGEVIADSNEGYKSKQSCMNGIELVKKAGDAEVDDQTGE